MRLHIAGRTTREIAAIISAPESPHASVTHVTVAKDIRERMALLAEENKREVQGWRDMQIARCQALIATWWRRAQTETLAFRRVLDAMARLDKYTGAQLADKVAFVGDRDSPPVQVEAVKGPADFDLSRLTLDELLQLRAIREKATVDQPSGSDTVH